PFAPAHRPHGHGANLPTQSSCYRCAQSTSHRGPFHSAHTVPFASPVNTYKPLEVVLQSIPPLRLDQPCRTSPLYWRSLAAQTPHGIFGTDHPPGCRSGLGARLALGGHGTPVGRSSSLLAYHIQQLSKRYREA